MSGFESLRPRPEGGDMKEMRLLFSARDPGRIEWAHDQLVRAGVSCEVRSFRTSGLEGGVLNYPELWVEANSDYHTASIIYASPLQLLRGR